MEENLLEELLNKPFCDFTVLEIMYLTHLKWMAENPTMDIEQVARTLGTTRRKVNELIKKKAFPDDLIVDGYGTKPLIKTRIYTQKLIDWMKEKPRF